MGGHPPTHFFPSLDSAELKRANKREQGFSLLPASVKLPAVTLSDEHVTRAAGRLFKDIGAIWLNIILIDSLSSGASSSVRSRFIDFLQNV